jgi:hypothetical protein
VKDGANQMLTAATLKPKSCSLKDSEESQEPWKGVCSSRCYFAQSDKKRCKCRCKGEHHGKGLPNEKIEKGIDEFF